LLLLLNGCNKDSGVQPSSDQPEWLRIKIDSMSANHDYSGTKVFRYKWRGDFVYHIEIPVSSCIYCELYTPEGVKIKFADNNELQDFMNNKTDMVLIWEWDK
jgi:hypothetical protein